MKIVVITGEESGDKLAASAIKELKKISNEPLKIYGIGGRAVSYTHLTLPTPPYV